MNKTKDNRYISDKEFVRIYEKVPRFCVEVLVKTKDGILITKRNISPFKGYWHFTGGTVYLKESIKKAIKRVAKEELNLDVEMVKMVGELEFLDDYKKRGQKHIISIAYIASAKDISNIKLNEQGSKYMFCKLREDIPKHMVKEHVCLLKKILKENKK